MITIVELLFLNGGPIRTKLMKLMLRENKKNNTKAAVRRTVTLCHRPGQNHCLSAEKKTETKPFSHTETHLSLNTQQIGMFAHVALFYS